MSFQLYSGGVLTAACGTNLDHGVLLVGYGVSEDGIKYWKVQRCPRGNSSVVGGGGGPTYVAAERLTLVVSVLSTN